MAKKKPAAANSLQLGIEKGLRIAAWILAVMHGLLSAFRFVIDTKPFEQAEKWFALILLVSVLLYLLMTKIRYPQTLYRIKGFLGSFRSYEQFFLIALFLWYAIICCIWQNINHLKYLKGLDFYILDTGIAALVLFPMALYAGKGKARIYVESFLHAVCIAYTVFAGWCMWHVFHLNILTVGITENREGDGYSLSSRRHGKASAQLIIVINRIIHIDLRNRQLGSHLILHDIPGVDHINTPFTAKIKDIIIDIVSGIQGQSTAQAVSLCIVTAADPLGSQQFLLCGTENTLGADNPEPVSLLGPFRQDIVDII